MVAHALNHDKFTRACQNRGSRRQRSKEQILRVHFRIKDSEAAGASYDLQYSVRLTIGCTRNTTSNLCYLFRISTCPKLLVVAKNTDSLTQEAVRESGEVHAGGRSYEIFPQQSLAVAQQVDTVKNFTSFGSPITNERVLSFLWRSCQRCFGTEKQAAL